VGLDLGDAHVGVDEDRGDGQQREREQRVGEAEADVGHRKADEREARHRPPDVGNAGDRELALAQMAEPQREREGHRARDAHGRSSQLEVPPELGEELASADAHAARDRLAPVDDEVDRVPEVEGGEDHARAARTHGVDSRWAKRSRPSRTKAMTMHSPPATTTLDLNTRSPKISPPRPPAFAKNARAARPTVVVVAKRTPAKISGRARGTSTRHSTWLSVSPMPRAASRASAGAAARPATTLRKMISSV